MWTKALDRMLSQLMSDGDFSLTYPDGTTRRYGDGTGDPVKVTLHDDSLPRKIVLSPDMAVGEGYMDGTITIEDDDLRGFLTLAIRNISSRRHALPWFMRPTHHLRRAGRFFQQFNPAPRARQNVAHHYDLSGALYDLFLDADRQYSCGYFPRPGMTLDEAQDAKKHHIAEKLRIEPGMRVLDIGCGWGGMGLTLARDYGAEVLGVTLSQEQHAMANARAEKAGLSDRARFELRDYRKVTGQFDRIVSVGMFEHVGSPHYDTYFAKVRELLGEDGVALIHTIGRAAPPGATSPWIRKYIFPGGYVPSMSEALRAIEPHDLFTLDVEVWRLHYAETLRHWHDRFVARQDEARALYDDRFCRMWRYYLLASELTFRHDKQVVFQFQLSPSQTAVPLTRDYLYPSDLYPSDEHEAPKFAQAAE
ncbi:cyclopropane-fatty-acyl-phospholipid synthase family protein [Rhodalgimonas zhirmunskyi]|uniref:Cyclopropane-fatty-acyl-phospholipid synthase family protein n=1 Tax=Rhodalgimonas zhirmunskyi TaxID=2964767 RepID=A0AAJ1U9X8_9RHOB|nr:cyclopropane-fatty-acyl-phospholipid synthase family protein [Rhodoalgimonas zhirmunskyi]MDQ2095654.1 cyclopropane-fatty-acyl-phospholipid synthase family protein [Rhodoalgimonas zhirmunskyi]